MLAQNQNIDTFWEDKNSDEMLHFLILGDGDQCLIG